MWCDVSPTNPAALKVQESQLFIQWKRFFLSRKPKWDPSANDDTQEASMVRSSTKDDTPTGPEVRRSSEDDTPRHTSPEARSGTKDVTPKHTGPEVTNPMVKSTKKRYDSAMVRSTKDNTLRYTGPMVSAPEIISAQGSNPTLLFREGSSKILSDYRGFGRPLTSTRLSSHTPLPPIV